MPKLKPDQIGHKDPNTDVNLEKFYREKSMEDKRVCTKCDKEFADGSKFCGGCGAKVEPVEANSGDVDQQNGGVSGYIAKWKKMKTASPILVGGAVGCGGCFLLFIIFNLIGGLIGIVGNLIFN